ncbi:MAG: DUF1554 domain-containing protein [Candidatus Daviesbacteria bacterium]|nr:DUF1554 domain-containing protein [Candidatus Daviesbacteria bacterium]
MIKIRGFTLMELLVVITIIGVLGGIGVTQFGGAQKNSRDTAKKADLDAIAKAYETSFDEFTQRYRALRVSDFGNGMIPEQSPGVSYEYTYGPDHSVTTEKRISAFKVCADLSDGSKYCKSSNQGAVPSPTPTPVPPTLTPTSPPGPTAIPTPTSTTAPTTTSTPLPIKRVFITSLLYNGDLGGLDGADLKCQARAQMTLLRGTWKAWLSDGTTHAVARFTRTNQYRLIDGTPIASSWNDLTDGTIANYINMDQWGFSPVRHNAWTNTTSGGYIIERQANKNCDNWTSSANYYTGVNGVTHNETFSGISDSYASQWTQLPFGEASCDTEYRLYCFEQ